MRDEIFFADKEIRCRFKASWILKSNLSEGKTKPTKPKKKPIHPFFKKYSLYFNIGLCNS